MPLNELCGLIEWVSNTLPLKVILEDHYKRRNGKKLYVSGQVQLPGPLASSRVHRASKLTK